VASGNADRICREGAAGGRDHSRARLGAAGRERHVGRDHDGALAGTFGDPVVGRIHVPADRNPLDRRMFRHRDRAVAHDEHVQREALGEMALGHAIDLLFHRTGTSVDVDGDGLRHAHRRMS
jgi:hypothetical protein